MERMTLNLDTKAAKVAEASLTVSRIGLGTWAIGGWMWGGTDDQESVNTIRAAVERGVNLIDTAPAYGFGRSEEIVGRAIAGGQLRSRVVIATKVGLEWKDGKVFRNASRDRILREVEDSLRRLRTDYIDIYDPLGRALDPRSGPPQRHCGVRDIPDNCSRSTRSSGGRSTLPRRRRSIAFCGSRSPIQWAPISWHRRRDPRLRPCKRRSNREAV
jgi:hypothetical protein